MSILDSLPKLPPTTQPPTSQPTNYELKPRHGFLTMLGIQFTSWLRSMLPGNTFKKCFSEEMAEYVKGLQKIDKTALGCFAKISTADATAITQQLTALPNTKETQEKLEKIITLFNSVPTSGNVKSEKAEENISLIKLGLQQQVERSTIQMPEEESTSIDYPTKNKTPQFSKPH